MTGWLKKKKNLADYPNLKWVFFFSWFFSFPHTPRHMSPEPPISLKFTSSPLHSACLTPPLESINSGLPSSYPVPLLIQLSHHLPNGRGWLSYHTILPLTTSHWKILYFSYMTRPNFYLEIWWSAHLQHCFSLCTASPCPHMHFAGATVLKSDCALESP